MVAAGSLTPKTLKHRILVCDDERHIVRLIQVNLERQGHTVFTAFDGKGALRELRRSEIEILVIDWDLPGPPSTNDVIAELRLMPGGNDVRVIVMRRPPGDDGPSIAAGLPPNRPSPSGSEARFPIVEIRKPFNPAELIDLFPHF